MKLWTLHFLFLVAYTEAARLLAFFPLETKSHHYVFRPIMEALGRRGHEVVYYTGYPYEGTVPPGIVQVDFSGELPDYQSTINLMDLVNNTVIEDLQTLFRFSFLLSPAFLESPTVQKLIHSDEKFDAVLSESYFIQECQSAFIHKFNAVGIEIVSLGDFGWMNELAGLPDNPSYQVDWKAELTQNMNFWDRLYSTYVRAVTTIAGYYYMTQTEKMVDHYFNYTGHESRPPFKRLLSNRSLILVNYHNVVGYPVPTPPHRKDIAGVTIKPRKPLPKKIQTFMDDATDGVIYFSLGSNLNVSNPVNREVVEAFMKVFQEVPQKVLMKWETATYYGKLPKNVHLEKWYPQQDVLAHKNALLFITHGGYLSLVEAVHFGVPVIGIPFFGDQAKNFRFVEEAGIGKMLKLGEINYDNVSRMVKEVLTNTTYKEQMTRRSKIFRDRLVEPLDEAVFWIEHVIKYPDVLKPKALSLSYIQLHLIDVMLFVISVLLAVVFIAWKTITITVKILKGKSMPRKMKTKYQSSPIPLSLSPRAVTPSEVKYRLRMLTPRKSPRHKINVYRGVINLPGQSLGRRVRRHHPAGENKNKTGDSKSRHSKSTFPRGKCLPTSEVWEEGEKILIYVFRTPKAMNLWTLPMLLLVASTEAARILVFIPIAAKSHHFVFRPVMEALGRRGHEVVYYTGYPYEGNIPPGIVQLDLSGELPNFHTTVNIMDFVNTTIIEETQKLFELSLFLIPYYMKSPTVQKLVHSDEKFDAVLSESYITQEYISAFIHKFNAVGIELVSLGDFGWMNELAGLPDNPSYQVDFKAELTQNMNFWQRVYNTYVYAVTHIGGYYYMKEMEKMVDQYFNYAGHESRPPFLKLLANRSLILVNYHNVVGFPVPKPPHRKDIGGVTITSRKPLPKKIQTIMDDALNGVIYFSLGSHINVSHPANKKLVEVFMKVFEEVPQKVLMKWEKAEFDGKLPKNVHLEKWYPQQDVLAHNNTVLFITHGGYLSLLEAVYFAVPAIGVPFFVDQPKNFRFADEVGVGKMLRLADINYYNVSRMVKEVLSNKTYKEEITRRSKIFRDRPMEPLDEAVFWIEHVIKYPDVLKPKAISLSYIQLHLIDVKLFIITVISAAMLLASKSITFIIKIVKEKCTTRKEKKS
ncbi:uncharacterized protein [Halyomorpha halys]|uniref:uncharacterized protein n=1 Tax=Halyomorpha halys TaxID=286706 RepID=UPI0034D25356